jgi:hypothetical protein
VKLIARNRIGSNNYTKNILIIAALISAWSVPGSAYPADSYAHLIDSWRMDFSFSGGIIHHDIESPDKVEIEMPEYLRLRKIYSDLANGNPVLQKDILTDNPLYHGASYSQLGIHARNGGVSINGRVLLEHRGMSFGVFNTDNSIVFPQLTISIDSSFTVSGEKFHFGLSSGNHNNLTLSEGLTIYNIDVQGNRLYLNWKNLILRYSTIGDMSASYDLNIGDVFYYSLACREINLFGGFGLNLQAGLYEYLQGYYTEDLETNREINFSTEIKRGNSLSIHSEAGFRRHNGSYFSRIDQGGNLIGIRYKMEKSRYRVNITAERRYYGRYFNQGFRSDKQSFIFRDNTRTMDYNTIGSHLYPIYLYLRPFSQWAVYTEYQGKDVNSYILRARGRYTLPYGFFISAFVDFNYLEVSNEDSFLYPFYDAGIGWNPIDDTHCSVTLTNRAMNLDERYPTLYEMESPVLQLSCFYRIEF